MGFKLRGIFFLINLSLLDFSSVEAQSAYTFSPSINYHVILDTNQINYDGIEIVNTGTSNLILTYQLVKKDTLIDSHFDLCNSGVCLVGLVPYGTIPTILPGQKGWLKMHQYSGKALGINTIKYIVRDGVTREDTLTFKIEVSNPSGINENAGNKNHFRVFPNPVSNGCLLIDSKSENSLFQITDLNGKEILSQKLSAGINPLVISEFNKGIYHYKITENSGNSFSGKLVIVH